MPTIVVTAFKRTQEQKEKLAKEITKDVCEIFNVKGDAVRIYFEDRIKENLFRNSIPATKW
jgi:phenylpyruvate tautomerase PptA (4-oxalocrotonate tautomerase family)